MANAKTALIIGASVGVAIAPFDGLTSDDLVRNADLALYAAKGNGRGRFRFYSSDLHQSAEDRRALEEDGRFVPALNNLGVVLMERGKAGEARVYFQQAFALDSGQSDSIRENLKRAIAQSESTVYDTPEEKPRFNLVRRGNGEYLLLSDI